MENLIGLLVPTLLNTIVFWIVNLVMAAVVAGGCSRCIDLRVIEHAPCQMGTLSWRRAWGGICLLWMHLVSCAEHVQDNLVVFI